MSNYILETNTAGIAGINVCGDTANGDILDYQNISYVSLKQET
jgi:hypothetical protein